MTSAPLIAINDLRISFPTRDGTPQEILHGIDLVIHPGEAVAIVGESGSGKSVTARALVGLAGNKAVITARQFDIAGQSVLNYSEREWRNLRGRQIGLVQQDALVSLDPLRTIGSQLSDASGSPYVLERSKTRATHLELLRSVGIRNAEHYISQYPHQLSGGLRQRALIAMALARHPALLIADEPTTALDVTVQKQIIALLEEKRRAGTTLLLISHDLAVVAGLADRIIVMRHGEIVEEGPAHSILATPSHPYTRQLLAAIPSGKTRGYRLSPPERPAGSGAGSIPASARIALPPKHIDVQRKVLQASHLVKYYNATHRKTPVLHDVSFELAAGEALGIVGESGSGKTTLSRIVLGLVAPDSGTVLMNGEPWSTLTEAQRRPRRAGIQLIAQDPLGSFDPRYDVEHIIGESLDALNIHGDERRRHVIKLLDSVRLGPAFLKRRPRELSGGQRQRVAIARAFAPGPKLLIADEPVSALDVSVQAQVLDLLAELQAASGTALLFISHDLGVVHHLTDRVLVMKDGNAIEEGDVTSIFAHPRQPYTKALIDAVPSLDYLGSHQTDATTFPLSKAC